MLITCDTGIYAIIINKIINFLIQALLLLVTAYARAQDVDNECDIPLTCSDSERDDDADFDSTVEFPM